VDDNSGGGGSSSGPKATLTEDSVYSNGASLGYDNSLMAVYHKK
jgi:hypothetical protein